MPDETEKTNIMHVHINGTELAVRLAELIFDVPRPEGASAGQALAALEPDDQTRLLRAAKMACEYVCSQINGRDTSAIEIRGGFN